MRTPAEREAERLRRWHQSVWMRPPVKPGPRTPWDRENEARSGITSRTYRLTPEGKALARWLRWERNAMRTT